MNSKKAFQAYKHLLATLLTALLLLAVCPAWAEPDQAGKVAILRGEVKAIDTTGNERTLAARAPIYVDDTINTGPNGQVQLLFKDESIYTLGPDSSLKIDSFVYDPATGAGELVTEATKGSFRMVTGAIAKKKPEQVKVRTPVATIGIRGTYFAGRVTPAGLQTMLVGGAIFVHNEAGMREINTPGFATTVPSHNRPPGPPVRLSPAEAREMLAPTEIGFKPQEPAPVAGTEAGTDVAGTAEQDAGETGTPPGTSSGPAPEPGPAPDTTSDSTSDSTAGTTSDSNSGPAPGSGPAPVATSDSTSGSTAGTTSGTTSGPAPGPGPAPGTSTGTTSAPPPGPAPNTTSGATSGTTYGTTSGTMLSTDYGTFTGTTSGPAPLPGPGPAPTPISPMLINDPVLTNTTFVDPVTSGNQQTTYNTLTTTTTATTYSVSGKYIGSDGDHNNGGTSWFGSISGSSTGNQRNLVLARAGYQNGLLNLTGPIYDPTRDPFKPTGSFAFPSTNMWGIPYGNGFVVYDQTGEFGYGYSELKSLMGFAGRPSLVAALPTDWVGVYHGHGGFFAPSGNDLERTSLYIDWNTGKVLGFIGGHGDEQVFFMGYLDRATNQIKGQMLGKMDGIGGEDFVKSVADSFVMDLYGSSLQGIAGKGGGNTFAYNDSINPLETWQGIMAMIGKPQSFDMLRPATETYNGFVSGISIPRADGPANLALLTNQNPGTVSLNLVRNTHPDINIKSTFTGTLDNITGTSLGGTTYNHFLNINVGTGVYIDDNAMASTNISPTGTVNGAAVSNVATAVNFVGTNPVLWEDDIANNIISYDHLTWGYWGVEYKNPGGTEFSVTPGSYWIAGELTPDVSLPVSGTGIYTGHAMGQAYDKSNSQLYALKGTSNLTADFGAKTLTGTLNMSNEPNATNRMDWVVNVNGGWTEGQNQITGNSTATITPYFNGTAQSPRTANDINNTMNAAFFNTNAGSAGAVGGNWKVEGASDVATGIFVGKK